MYLFLQTLVKINHQKWNILLYSITEWKFGIFNMLESWITRISMQEKKTAVEVYLVFWSVCWAIQSNFVRVKGVYFFLATPTVRPRRPVVLVCWPRTRRSQWWRRPRWARIWIYSLDSCIKSTDISLIKTQKICLPSWVAPNPHGAWCQDRWRLTGQRYRPSSPFVCSRTSLGFCTGVGWAWWSPYDGSRPRPIDRHAEWYFSDQSLIGLQVGTNSTAHESRHWDTGPFRETVLGGIKWVKCWELISPVSHFC